MDVLCTSMLRGSRRLYCRRWLNPILSLHLAKAVSPNHPQRDRSLCTSASLGQHFLTQRLTNRTLLRFSGKDTSEFLQGLLTNDMECLHAGKVDCGKTLYTLMLNVQGRVLYDLILYAVGKQKAADTSDDSPLTELLMECDTTVTQELVKILKRYKIRKKVDIVPVGEEFSVWSAVPDSPTDTSPVPVTVTDPAQVVMCEPDPRLKALGYRLLLPTGVNASAVLDNCTETSDDLFYRAHRYSLGVPEGCDELPPGGCLPLESNAVFLKGVSFNKGCYIGQELTARSFHTGLTRKRIMPLELDSEISVDGKVSVENAAGKKCGSVRGACGRVGLGLLRIPDTIGKGPLNVKDADGGLLTAGTTHIPDWWPLDTDSILKQVLTDHPDAAPKTK